MSYQNDAFSLSFNDLYEKYPDRRLDLFRYKVKNYNDTLRNVIVHPQRNVLFLLEDETEINAVLNTYQGIKTAISISSGQAPGASEGINNESIVILTSDLLPNNYRNEMYVYTFNKINSKNLSSEPLYIDTLGASTFPDYQEFFFKNSADAEKKVSNVLTLGKLSLKTPSSNYKSYSYFDDDLDYFDGNSNIKLSLPGLLGEFGSSYIDESNHKRQAEYELQEDDTHKYALIQAQPTRIKPELVLSSDTYDENKNLRFEIARLFIGKQESIASIWTEFGFKTNTTDAAGKLYKAFLTAVYLANQRISEFKDLRITDKASPNLGKIDTSSLRNAIYGVSVDDILSVPQKEFTGRIFKTWEQEFADELKDGSSALNSLYQSVKSLLAGLTEYIPSPYSFGNYHKIGRLALEWYFVPETMNISINTLTNSGVFKVQLQSAKYIFNDTKQIIGLKPEYRKISSVRTFNLDGQVSLPSIPNTFVEENKNSSAGAIDISNTSFLNYTWVFQLKSQSKYANLFQTNNPFIIKGTVSNTNTLTTINKKIFDKNDGTYTENTLPGLESYIQNNLMTINRKIVADSAQVVITSVTTEKTEYVYNPVIGGPRPYSPNIVRTTTYKYVLTWQETQLPAISATPIKPPFSIDQSQWESFETALGSNVSEFLLKPIYLEKIDAVRKLSDIYWKATLANYAIIELTAVKKDGSKEKVTFEFEQGFKRDQTLVQEGVYI